MSTLVKPDNNVVELVKVLFPHLQGISDVEIRKAIALAKHLGLDPTKREVHFVPFKGSLQLVVSYTEYIKRAERSGKLNGWDVAVGKDEVGTFAETTIYRKDWEHPLRWKVYLSEVKKDTQSWKSMPIFMLKKVCIAQAFRLAFTEETNELPYEESELVPAIPEEKEPEPEPEPQNTISEAQVKRLWAIIRTTAKYHNISEEETELIVRTVLADFGIESTKDIPTNLYDEITETIKQRLEAGGKSVSN
jgi:phage recombination protein Bet